MMRNTDRILLAMLGFKPMTDSGNAYDDANAREADGEVQHSPVADRVP